MFFAGDIEDANPLSVGTRRAVSETLPLLDGRQLQETERALELLLMQPGILLPFAKNVTFPSEPATPREKENVVALLYENVGLPVSESDVAVGAAPPPVP